MKTAPYPGQNSAQGPFFQPASVSWHPRPVSISVETPAPPDQSVFVTLPLEMPTLSTITSPVSPFQNLPSTLTGSSNCSSRAHAGLAEKLPADFYRMPPELCECGNLTIPERQVPSSADGALKPCLEPFAANVWRQPLHRRPGFATGAERQRLIWRRLAAKFYRLHRRHWDRQWHLVIDCPATHP